MCLPLPACCPSDCARTDAPAAAPRLTLPTRLIAVLAHDSRTLHMRLAAVGPKH